MCAPIESAEVVTWQLTVAPVPASTQEPTVAEPSVTETVPVAGPVDEVTETVKVTEPPRLIEVAVAASVVVVATVETSCVVADEVDQAPHPVGWQHAGRQRGAQLAGHNSCWPGLRAPRARRRDRPHVRSHPNAHSRHPGTVRRAR